MSDPYVVTPTWDGYCAGCGDKLWLPSRRWAHRRCAMTLLKHRQPFVTKDHLSVWAERLWPSHSPSTESETPA